jgi:hypothetical protein
VKMPDRRGSDMSWVKDGAIVKLDGRVGVVTRNPNADGQVKIRWSDTADGTMSGYVDAARLKKARPEDQLSAVDWCMKGTVVKLDDEVGVVLEEPDVDGEVKLRWVEGGGEVYKQAAHLIRANAGERRSSISWCREDTPAWCGHKVGVVLDEPDSDDEVQLRWADGTKSDYLKASVLVRSFKNIIVKLDGRVGVVTRNPNADGQVKIRWSDTADGTMSGYVDAARLKKARPEDQLSAVDWCMKGTVVKLDGKVGVVLEEPDVDGEVELRWADGSKSDWIKAARLTRVPGTVVAIGGEIEPGQEFSDELYKRLHELAGGSGAGWVGISSKQHPLVSDINLPWSAGQFARLESNHLRKYYSPGSKKRRQWRTEADCEAWKLQAATGVYLGGSKTVGRSEILAAKYCDTEVESELKALVERGGVIAASSSAASTLSRPRTTGPTPGGFDLVPRACIGWSHDTNRDHQDTIRKLVAKKGNETIGWVIDDQTAIIVSPIAAGCWDDYCIEVVGTGTVTAYAFRTVHGRRQEGMCVLNGEEEPTCQESEVRSLMRWRNADYDTDSISEDEDEPLLIHDEESDAGDEEFDDKDEVVSPSSTGRRAPDSAQATGERRKAWSKLRQRWARS